MDKSLALNTMWVCSASRTALRSDHGAHPAYQAHPHTLNRYDLILLFRLRASLGLPKILLFGLVNAFTLKGWLDEPLVLVGSGVRLLCTVTSRDPRYEFTRIRAFYQLVCICE